MQKNTDQARFNQQQINKTSQSVFFSEVGSKHVAVISKVEDVEVANRKQTSCFKGEV